MTDDSARPWGYYEILYDGDDCKVKRIVVKPGKKLSLQYHHRREEFWKVISGEGVIVRGNKQHSTKSMPNVFIFKEMKHRIENTGDVDLVFIEIQTGAYFGEDDIVRLEDDYGRT